MEFEIIELDNPKWDDYINSCYIYDFHHTSCFHKIEVKSKEKAKLFIVKTKQELIALPLIIKKIPLTNYYDATSVYGYCGPLASQSFEKLSKKLILYFKKEFIKYCNQNNIISVFSRLHPLVSYNNFFSDFGECKDLNKTIIIDLKLPLDEQRKGYRKSNKSEINQLVKKKGYVVENISPHDDKQINEFVNIYHETMKRVNAKEYYFFDFNYFKKLLNNLCFKCHLLVAIKDNNMAAGAIFTETKSIMQYHLAGTKQEYIKDTSMKLIIDKARLLGNKNKLHYLHLGGGVDGEDEDSLFRFKAGFSKQFCQFSVWNMIVNQQAYHSLVKEKGNIKANNFFPLYRA